MVLAFNLWDGIISVLAFIFALGLIIIIHEGGHFFFARRANILCRFSDAQTRRQYDYVKNKENKAD